jgi:hypothetical protein
MDIVPYAPHLLPALTQLANRHIATIPPYWTLAESQVAEMLATPSPWSIHYPGIEHAIAWIQPENGVALRICHSLGFADGPECWEYEKVIK